MVFNNTELKMNKEKYQRYKELKLLLAGKMVADLPLDRMSAWFIADMVYRLPERSLLGRLLTYLKFMFFMPKLKGSKFKSRSLFGWSQNRVDYAMLAQSYKNKLGWEFEDICLSATENGWHFKFDIKAAVRSIKVLWKLENVDLKDRIIIGFAVYASVSYMHYVFSKIDLKGVQNYLSSNSSFAYEAVFTLILNKREVKTYSIQHGMYFEYKNDTPYDVVNYENITASIMLVWGAFSAEQIKRHIPNGVEVEVFGHPAYIGRGFRNSFDSNSNLFLVGLPRVMYKDEVAQLIRLLASDRLKTFSFKLRLHPAFDRRAFQKSISGIDNVELSDEKTFEGEFRSSNYLGFIGFNSTVMFEALLYNIPVLQYKSGNDEFDNVGFIEFDEVQQLLGSVELLRLNKIEVDRKLFFG